MQEKQLLDISKAFDTAIQRDRAAIDALLAEDVTVHKGAHVFLFERKTAHA